MKLTLRQQIMQFAQVLQSQLFPVLEEEVGELTEPAKPLVATLEMIPLARFVPASRGWVGRPLKARLAVASAFVAKAIYGFSLTRQLLDALQRDAQLRRICGWERASQVPHESTFSRAFAEFARMELPQFVHEALIRQTQQQRLIPHCARFHGHRSPRTLPGDARASGRAEKGTRHPAPGGTCGGTSRAQGCCRCRMPPAQARPAWSA